MKWPDVIPERHLYHGKRIERIYKQCTNLVVANASKTMCAVPVVVNDPVMRNKTGAAYCRVSETINR
jgi:hypothetical protein